MIVGAGTFFWICMIFSMICRSLIHTFFCQPHTNSYYGFVGRLNIYYRLVWATELLLAAIGLVFPALVLGYKSFNCSMYQVPVPTLIENFVWIYFKQLLLVAGSIIFWHTNSRSLQSILYQFLCTFLNFYELPSNS